MSNNNSTPLSAKPALLGLTLDELTAVAVELGLPRFVGKQLCGWIYDKHARSFDEMTNLSKAARARLAETYVLGISTPVESVESRDGTIKYLFRTAKGHYIESVFIPDGERATVLAAGALKAGMVVSTQSSIPVEDLAREAAAPLWFQLYLQPEREHSLALLRRAEAAGCGAVVVTVDAPVNSPRNREQRAGFSLPPGVEAVHLRGMTGPPPQTAHAGGNALLGTPLLAAAPSWRDIEWLRGQTRLPLLLKGVLSPRDARRALEHGIDGLVVSNHGGRSLDSLPATLEALPAIAQAGRGEVPLLLDGGIRRGTDVLKALALGASAVMVGRPCLHGLATAGAVGVAHVLHILRVELEIAMALCGCRRLADIGPEVLFPQR